MALPGIRASNAGQLFTISLQYDITKMLLVSPVKAEQNPRALAWWRG